MKKFTDKYFKKEGKGKKKCLVEYERSEAFEGIQQCTTSEKKYGVILFGFTVSHGLAVQHKFCSIFGGNLAFYK